jgi:hypothetical protein
MPAPTMPVRGSSLLMPEDVIAERQAPDAAGPHALHGIDDGCGDRRGDALVATLTSLALQERNLLREKVAVSRRVRRGSWITKRRGGGRARRRSLHLAAADAAALHEPESSKEASITHWEWTPERLSIIGRMPSASLALEYTQELKVQRSARRFRARRSAAGHRQRQQRHL